MADRTSARLFGEMFTLLAEYNDERARKMARVLWDRSGDYDFSNYQMGADDALITLGLACRGIDPDYPEDGETVRYAGERGGPDAR